MIELNNEMTHAEMVAYFAAAHKMLSDLMASKDREKAAKKKLAKQSNPRAGE
jgi:hypothetical protein